MSKVVAWEENVYFEMEPKRATGPGLYDDPVGGCEIRGTKQTNRPEKHVAEKSRRISTEPAHSKSPSEAVMLKWLLCIIVSVVTVSFLISAATLILAITMMISGRSTSITSIDCGGAVQSIEKKVQDLTERLETTQSELKTLKTQSDGQMAANSTLRVQENDLKYVWMTINSTAEKISNLSSKVMNGFKRLEGRVKIEEQISNDTSQVAEQHFKKIMHLESMLNSTRQDAKKVSRQLNVLWSAGNSTQKELQNVWMAINATQTGLEENLMKVKVNLTKQEQLHFKKIGDLENMLNATCQEAKEETRQHLTELWSAAANLTQKELHRVWMTLNATQIGLEETLMKVKVNLTKQEQLHFKKIEDLENMLNATLQEEKEETRHHLTELWSATNHTQKELDSVWMAVNTTQIGLEETLMKVKVNSTKQGKLVADHITRLEQISRHISSLWNASNSTAIRVNELNKGWTEMNTTMKESSSLMDKLNNISKMTGPIGPPGFNGSQGPAGPAGSVGPPGPKGSGDFSSCQYKVVTGTATPGGSEATAGLAEPNGKRVLGVSCSTNYAEEYNLFETVHNNVRRYSCNCKGTSSLFTPFGGQQKSCYLHYWECPLTT